MDTSLKYLKSFKPYPNAEKVIDHLLGRKHLEVPPMIEFIVDEPIIRTILTCWLGRPWVPPTGDRDAQKVYLDNLITFWYSMGYDVLRFEASLPFPGLSRVSSDTSKSTSARSWAEESQGVISSWEDFEHYSFPKVDEFDFFPFEYLSRNLPEGMGLAFAHGGGIFERVSWIFSIEKLCYYLYDQPDLVRTVIGKVGELQVDFYRQLVDFEGVVAIFPGDDMGFRSGTLISPSDLRELFLPWHAHIAKMAHERNIPYFLHSCGNLEKIMPDLIEFVSIDAKHSFEDAILPVEKFQEKYGQCVAALGGIDIHLLAAGSQGEVRKRVRSLVENCGPKGRFAIGSGNSIPDYVPVENYLAMIDEILSFYK